MSAWKAWEREVAKRLGGVRRGPDTRGPEGGKTDIVHPVFAIECKHIARPSFVHFITAIRQAEANAQPHHRLCLAAIHRKGDDYSDGLVVMRIGDVADWFGDGGEGDG